MGSRDKSVSHILPLMVGLYQTGLICVGGTEPALPEPDVMSGLSVDTKYFSVGADLCVARKPEKIYSLRRGRHLSGGSSPPHGGVYDYNQEWQGREFLNKERIWMKPQTFHYDRW